MKRFFSGICILALIVQIITINASADGTDMISNFMAAAGDGYATVSWKNNDCSQAGRFELYDENGARIAGSSVNAAENVTIEGGEGRLSLESGAWNRVIISGLSNGKEYSYRLKITDRTGGNREYIDSAVPSGRADGGIENWEIVSEGANYSKTEYTGDAYSGERAVKIRSNADGAAGGIKFIPALKAELEEGKQYRLKFYAKAEGSYSFFAGFGTGADRYADIGTQWTLCQKDLTYSGGDLQIVLDGMCEWIYFDEFSLHAIEFGGESGINLVSAGGFEEEKEAEEPGEEIEESEADFPVNFIASGRGTEAVVSWKNPDRDDISSIKLFDSEGNEISAEIGMGAGEINAIRQTGLSSDKRYIYELKIKYAAGNECSVSCISNIIKTGSGSWSGDFVGQEDITGWKDVTSGTPYTRVSISEEECHSGNASLKVQRNAARLSNNFQQIGPQWASDTFGYEKGKKYLVEFYYKLLNFSGGNGVRFIFKTDPNIDFSSLSASNEWTYFSKIIDGSAMADIDAQTWHPRIFIDVPLGALYIDDYAVYELDADGEKTGENLIVDGSFEYPADTVFPSEVLNAKAGGGSGKVSISWENSDGSYDYVYIYQYHNGEPVLRKIVPADKNSADITGAVSDSYIIKTSAKTGPTSDGITVEYVPGEYEIYDVKLSQNGSFIDGLKPGDVTVSARAGNNSENDGFEITMIAAVFKDDELISVKKAYKNLGADSSSVLTARVTVPDDAGECKMYVYFWNNTDLMTTVRDCVLFE